MARWTRRAILGGTGLVAAGAAGLYFDRAGAADAYAEAEREVWRPTTEMPADERARTRRLVHYASLAANGHNTQPWIFRIEADGLRIAPDTGRRTPVVDPDDHHLYASLGCAAANLAIAAEQYGLGTAIAGSADGVEVRWETGAVPDAPSPLFRAITERQCVRADYDGEPLATADWDAILRAGALPGVDVALQVAPGERAALADLVVAGNTAQMGDPAFVAELKAWIRFDGRHAVRTRDGLYAASSGNPTLPPWLGRRMFDIAFATEPENAKIRSQVLSSAGIAVILAERNDPEGWIAAGRAAQRMALEAAARGIRSAFLNQPTEALTVRPQLQAYLGTARRPNLVMRFGRGPTVPRSLRRPPEAVIA